MFAQRWLSAFTKMHIYVSLSELLLLFSFVLFQLVSEQQESRPLLSPSIDDFLCETKCDGAARPVTSNTAGNGKADPPLKMSSSRPHSKCS